MSQANVEIVKRVVAAFNLRDIESFMQVTTMKMRDPSGAL
jgi:hypothetical protein